MLKRLGRSGQGGRSNGRLSVWGQGLFTLDEFGVLHPALLDDAEPRAYGVRRRELSLPMGETLEPQLDLSRVVPAEDLDDHLL